MGHLTSGLRRRLARLIPATVQLFRIVASCTADIPVGSGSYFAGFHIWLKSESGGNAGWKTGVTAKSELLSATHPGLTSLVSLL
jgi:hypothetical protein